MTKQTEALKMAIEALDTLMMEKGSIYQQALQACKDALEQPLTRDWKETIDERIAKDDAFKQALEQPAQEPVAWMNDIAFSMDKDELTTDKFGDIVPLYTHPAPVWQGLSDDEIDEINGSPMALEHSSLYKFARAIEQALKEKNAVI